VVNAIPFGRGDYANMRTFAERVDPAFLPWPQGAAPSISVEHDRLEASLPSTFETYREILISTGINLAAVPVRDQAQVDAVLWTAIRAGWREGYTLETDLNSDAASTDQVPVTCTRFIVQAHQDSEQIEVIYRQIRALVSRKFDFEIEFDRELSTPETIDACLRFLKSRDRQVHFVTPHLDALSALGDIAVVARQHGALLGIRSVGLLPATVLQRIGRATGGKLSYRICQPTTGEPARLIAIAREKLRS
jgi:hypothetical protein